MYLTRLILNLKSRQVQREIADPYQLHRTIMSAFPEELPPDERVLFRLETDVRNQAPFILVQSQHHPDWSGLLDDNKRFYLLELSNQNGEHANPDVKSVNLRLSPGQYLSFRLLANPTVKRNGKRYGLYREQEQNDWLNRKIELAGANVISVRTSHQSRVYGGLFRKGHKYNLQFSAIRFDGILRVIDPERLISAVNQGIGSGKGLGFGMLSLAPSDS